MGTEFYKQFPEPIPVVVSGGGTGRGSWFLEQAFEMFCLLKGRRPLAEEERRSEATILKRLLLDEGIAPSWSTRNLRQRHSEENFLNSLGLFAKLIDDGKLPKGACHWDSTKSSQSAASAEDWRTGLLRGRRPKNQVPQSRDN